MVTEWPPAGRSGGKGPPLGAHSPHLGDRLLSAAGPLVRPEAWVAPPEGFPPTFLQQQIWIRVLKKFFRGSRSVR